MTTLERLGAYLAAGKNLTPSGLANAKLHLLDSVAAWVAGMGTQEGRALLAFRRETLGDAVEYLVPQLKVNIEFYEGKPMSVELPPTVDLTVVETEPGLKGASVSNVTKAAKLETGLVVQVPPFINEGEKVRINTAEGTYQERA